MLLVNHRLDCEIRNHSQLEVQGRDENIVRENGFDHI